jgi:hypothetical protein
VVKKCNVIAARELRELAATYMERLEGQVVEAGYKELDAKMDTHLHHTKGWSHEVWIACLALSAVLPPTKEERDDEEENL